MYIGTITVPQLPTVLPTLTILSLLEADRPDSWSWRLSIQNLERGKIITEARGFANSTQRGPIVMPVKFAGLRFDESGSYSVVLEHEGQQEPAAVVPFSVILMPQSIPGQQGFPRG